MAEERKVFTPDPEGEEPQSATTTENRQVDVKVDRLAQREQNNHVQSMQQHIAHSTSVIGVRHNNSKEFSKFAGAIQNLTTSVRDAFRSIKSVEMKADQKVKSLAHQVDRLPKVIPVTANQSSKIASMERDIQETKAQVKRVNHFPGVANIEKDVRKIKAKVEQVSRVQKKVDPNQALETDIREIKAKVQQTSLVQRGINSVQRLISDLTSRISLISQSVRANKRSMRVLEYKMLIQNQQRNEALGGNILQVGVDQEISADELNTAVAGEFTKIALCSLKYRYVVDEENVDTTHEWANFACDTPVPVENCDDEHISAPTVKWALDVDSDPRYVEGILQLLITFDTDAGVTKEYAVDDTLTVTIPVNASGTVAGVTVADVVITFTVVA